MATIEDRIKERMDSRPDEHTLAWWQDQFTQVVKGYRGLSHACNCVLAENEDQHKKIEELRKLVSLHTELIQKAQATIGELQADVVDLRKLLEKARTAFKGLKNTVAHREPT